MSLFNNLFRTENSSHKPPLSSWPLWCRHLGERKCFSHGDFPPPPLGRHPPASLEHKLGKVCRGAGEGEEELEMFASK